MPHGATTVSTARATTMPTVFFFYMGYGDLNSTPHDYEVRTSPTEPCPQIKINDYVLLFVSGYAICYDGFYQITFILTYKTSWLHLCVSVSLLCSIDPCLCPC